MATYTSTRAGSTYQPRANAGETIVSEEFTVATALALNDVIQMVKIPAGAVIQEIVLSSDDLDTGGTPAITLDVGDGDDTDRFIKDSDIGQAGGVARLDQFGGHLHKYTAEDTIDVLVSAAPATGATSVSIRLTVIYVVDGI